jgi:hypothetical protein
MGYTYLFAVHIFFHFKTVRVRRALDAITSQKLSQILFVDFGTAAGSAKEVIING